MTLKREVTIGELLVLIGMFGSLLMGLIWVGEYKAHLDETLVAVRNMSQQMDSVEVQSNHIQEQVAEQSHSINNLTKRITSVEQWIALVKANENYPESIIRHH